MKHEGADLSMDTMVRPFAFACPVCRTPLEPNGMGSLRCPEDDATYRQRDGIWRFLSPERAANYEPFLEEYEEIRRSEGRGSGDSRYYRALPFRDLTERFSREWRIRATSFRVLVERVVAPMEEQVGSLRILDMGAGNGWLSYRLGRRGHDVAAVDLLVNDFDGLGAQVHYDTDFVPLQADFDRLPLVGRQVDLVIYNGALHYARDYETTLGEALRVLREGGQVVAMDSPVYHDGASGKQMVQEREARFERVYGFRSDALGSQGYLTYRRIDQLGRDLGLTWQRMVPWYGWRWALRPWKARLLGRREPAAFLLLVGTR